MSARCKPSLLYPPDDIGERKQERLFVGHKKDGGAATAQALQRDHAARPDNGVVQREGVLDGDEVGGREHQPVHGADVTARTRSDNIANFAGLQSRGEFEQRALAGSALTDNADNTGVRRGG